MTLTGSSEWTFALLILIGTVLSPMPTSADEAPNMDAIWGGTLIDSNGWLPPSGSENNFSGSPSTGPEDPYIYEARYACADGDSVIFPECATVVPACSTGGGPVGEPGTAIYWYQALRAIAPPDWMFSSGPTCFYDEKPRDLLAEIAELIAHEFQRTPVAPATMGSQPGPHTLRGEETNVWAEASTQIFPISMLGQDVTITAVPVAYTWDYGDGTVWGPTPVHGAPLHADRIGEQTQTSHVYTATGRLAITLTTHFNGTYTVNGGPQLPIPGQGNIPTAPLALTVWRAETNLYAENCFQNPDGVGC